ncbi:uncharacterized protein B0I36DRAFT_266148, partial [Microdochium trichocladiopsis]
ARLIAISAATYQLSAGFHGFFWPKVFWDFATKKVDRAVYPIPILQLLNVVSALGILALEWPSRYLVRFQSRTTIHFIALLLAAIPAALLFQSVDAVLYYSVAAVLYW